MVFSSLLDCEPALDAYGKREYVIARPDPILVSSLGKDKEALSAIEKSISINPFFVESWISKGAVLSRLDQYDKALTAFEQAISLNPNHFKAWNLKRIVLEILDRDQEANEAAAKAQTLWLDEPIHITKDPVAWYNKGVALGKAGRIKEALIVFDKAIELKPDFEAAWKDKALALNILGHHEEAFKAVEQALNLNPVFKEALELRKILKEKLAL